MTRRSAEAVRERAKRGPADRQGLWTWMRGHRAWSWAEIRDAARLDPASVREYLAGLAAAGYVIREGDHYALLRDAGLEAPRVRRDGSPVPEPKSERIWRALRVMKRVTVAELEVACPDVPGSYLRDYLRNLARAGVVAHAGETWALLPTRVTGPRAPMVLRDGRIWDPNRGRVVEGER